MLKRCRVLIALLMVALQASDLVVGALGHSHGGHAQCSEAAVVAEAHGHSAHEACSHHHHCSPQKSAEPCSDTNRPDPARHDDCAICRHFSQPAACVAVAIVLVGVEQAEQAFVALSAFVFSSPVTVHLARGPPSLCA